MPAFPASIGSSGARSPRTPTPWTTSSSSATSSTRTPSARTASTVDFVSAERPKPRTCVSPSASAPMSTARCEIDLSPGTARCPTNDPAGSTRVTSASHPSRGVRHQSGDRASCPDAGAMPGAARLRHTHDTMSDTGTRHSRTGETTTWYPCASRILAARSASSAPPTSSVSVPPRSRRQVLQLEVLDVDALRAERLRDPGEDSRPVGHVHAQPLQHSRLLVGVGKHAPPVVGRLADPARKEARVTGRERLLDLLDAPPVLGERRATEPPRCRGRCRPRCAGSHRRPASCPAATLRRAASGS